MVFISLLKMVKGRAESKTDKLLKKIYYNPSAPGSFAGVNALHNAVKKVNTNKRIKITKSKVEQFLSGQDTFTLHKQPRRFYPRRRVMVAGPLEQFQIDLVDMTRFSGENNGYNFILMVIDIFSKKAFAVGVKRKQAKEMVSALKEIFKLTKPPLKIQSDKGQEFKAKEVQAYFKSIGVKWFSAEDEKMKSQIVERLNRTIKGKMYKVFYHNENNKWIDILPKLINSYNNTLHSSTKTTPNIAANGDPEVVSKVREALYGIHSRLNRGVEKEIDRPTAPALKVGDRVRLSENKHIFKKAYLPSWTEEQFVVDKIYNTTPTSYLISDLAKEEIKGYFYSSELQKVKGKSIYKINKVLQEKGDKVLVSWKGYPAKFNQWIHKSGLLKNA